MDYLDSKFQILVTPEKLYPYPSSPCAVVPNAAVSSREIFRLYSKGVEVPHNNHQTETVVHGGYYPTDPMEALQLANDAVAALMPPSLPSSGSSVPSSEPESPPSPSVTE